MKLCVLLILSLAITAGCSTREDKLAFDGQYFRSSAVKLDDDRRVFVVNVAPVSASFEGALEAGRYEATRYCILNFGNSAVDWVIGPDQDQSTYDVSDDRLELQGACEE